MSAPLRSSTRRSCSRLFELGPWYDARAACPSGCAARLTGLDSGARRRPHAMPGTAATLPRRRDSASTDIGTTTSCPVGHVVGDQLPGRRRTPVSLSRLWAPSRVPRMLRSARHAPLACTYRSRHLGQRLTWLPVPPGRIGRHPSSSEPTHRGGTRFMPRPASSEHPQTAAGTSLPASRMPSRMSDPGRRRPADDEEHDQRDDRVAVGVGELEHKTEEQGAEPARAPLGRLVEAEVLGLAPARDQLAEQRPGQRLAAAEHQADQHRQRQEQPEAARPA